VVDRLTPEARSRLMASIRGKDTKPEMTVRRLLDTMGYRFRLHRHDLPGTPNVVLPRHGKAIFVHGCFLHGHEGLPARPPFKEPCRVSGTEDRREPRTRRGKAAALRRAGWSVATLWECGTRQMNKLAARLRRLLTT
jgi:DNA mismatch endonuclease (patch repair protein)